MTELEVDQGKAHVFSSSPQENVLAAEGNQRPALLNDLQTLCPRCSGKLYCNGHRYVDGVAIQRYKCAACGYRPGEKQQGLKGVSDNQEGNQKNVLLGSMALVALEQKTESNAGEQKQLDQTQQGLILEFEWKQKKRQKKPKTIYDRSRLLMQLVKLGCNLKDPESFETILATETIPTPTKKNMVATYAAFCKAFKIAWEKIEIDYETPVAFDPLEEEVDMLITACGKTTAAFLQALKDTGARVGEMRRVEWTDINEQKRTISINHPEKGSRAREVPVTEKTIALLKMLPKKYGNRIFTRTAGNNSFYNVRKRLAAQMNNPRLLKIHFHSLRHFRGSRVYEETGDLYAVKDTLGHKSIANTDRYQHSHYNSDEWIVKRPKDAAEEDALLSANFTFVRYDDKQGCPIYRKRK